MSQIFGGGNQNFSGGDALIDYLTLGMMASPERTAREGRERDAQDARTNYLQNQARLMGVQADQADPGFQMQQQMQQMALQSLLGEAQGSGGRSGSGQGGASGFQLQKLLLDQQKVDDAFSKFVKDSRFDARKQSLSEYGTLDPVSGKRIHSPEDLANVDRDVNKFLRNLVARSGRDADKYLNPFGASSPAPSPSSGKSGAQAAAPTASGSGSGGGSGGSAQIAPPQLAQVLARNPDLDPVKVIQSTNPTVVGEDRIASAIAKGQMDQSKLESMSPVERLRALFEGKTEAPPQTGMMADMNAHQLEQKIGAPLPKGLFSMIDIEAQASQANPGQPYQAPPPPTTPYGEAIRALWEVFKDIGVLNQGYSETTPGGTDTFADITRKQQVLGAPAEPLDGATSFQLMDEISNLPAGAPQRRYLAGWMQRFSAPLAEEEGSAREFALQQLQQPSPAMMNIGGLGALGASAVGAMVGGL